MKIKIRTGVFETNSSNEHTVAIAKTDEFNAWRDCKLFARVKCINECQETNGNFWSDRIELEFCDSPEAAEKWNASVMKSTVEERAASIKRHWEQYQAMQVEEAYKDDPYPLPNYTEKDFLNAMHELDDMNEREFSRLFGFMYTGMYMTFDQFLNEFKTDCYSTYQHDCPSVGVTLFGKYFHS